MKPLFGYLFLAIGISFGIASNSLAKLLEAIPKDIPIAKNKYPNSGFIIIVSLINLPSKLRLLSILNQLLNINSELDYI